MRMRPTNLPIPAPVWHTSSCRAVSRWYLPKQGFEDVEDHFQPHVVKGMLFLFQGMPLWCLSQGSDKFGHKAKSSNLSDNSNRGILAKQRWIWHEVVGIFVHTYGDTPATPLGQDRLALVLHAQIALHSPCMQPNSGSMWQFIPNLDYLAWNTLRRPRASR